MKKLKWAANQEEVAYMRARKAENIAASNKNHNENWMADRLKAAPVRFVRQTVWGYRVFDFWCARLGVVVEVDGAEHNKGYDAYRDEYNFRRSAILVLRVRNRHEGDASAAVETVKKLVTRGERATIIGISGKKERQKARIGKLPYPPSYLKQYLCELSACEHESQIKWESLEHFAREYVIAQSQTPSRWLAPTPGRLTDADDHGIDVPW